MKSLNSIHLPPDEVADINAEALELLLYQMEGHLTVRPAQTPYPERYAKLLRNRKRAEQLVETISRADCEQEDKIRVTKTAHYLDSALRQAWG